MTNNYKSLFFSALIMALFFTTDMFAQSIELRGVRNTMRYDDGDDAKSEYLGWDSATGTAMFSGDYGLWSLDLNGSAITSELVHYDNLMYGNSGSFYKNGIIYTVFSHEDPDATESGVMEFVVRKWDAETFEMISSQRFPKSANLESRGMAYNPTDGKVYGVFYLTDVELPGGVDELDEEDIQEGFTTDAGYALCTIDLETMEITQITPGVYYDNYVTLACSPEGRMFSMTSGGTLVEWDCQTGLQRTKTVVNDYGEEVQVSIYDHSGVKSQFKRQAACFDHNSGKMYWNGYVNNGMGYNDWGSYGPLSDREWRTNGKYDTCLYEVDIVTGAATKIANIPNRIAFSCLWVVGADGTTGTTTPVESAIVDNASKTEIFNIAGQQVSTATHGLYIIKEGGRAKKILRK